MNTPINQNLNDKLMFIGVFAVTLQGLSKNGRGSRVAGGEVAPVDVAKWRVFKGFPKMGKLSPKVTDEGAKPYGTRN